MPAPALNLSEFDVSRPFRPERGDVFHGTATGLPVDFYERRLVRVTHLPSGRTATESSAAVKVARRVLAGVDVHVESADEALDALRRCGPRGGLVYSPAKWRKRRDAAGLFLVDLDGAVRALVGRDECGRPNAWGAPVSAALWKSRVGRHVVVVSAWPEDGVRLGAENCA